MKPSGIKIAYLSSEYPNVTHTFIRRELRGVECFGIEVVRVSVRRPDVVDLPDPADREELEQTVGILNRGALLFWDVLVVALMNPLAWIRTAARSIGYGLRSDRGMVRHLAYFVEACMLRRLLSQRKVQHVHAHFGENATMVAMLTKFLGGPAYSFQIHGPLEFDAPVSIFLATKVAEAKFVTAITDFARGQTLRWSAPEHWKKVHVVRCGVDDQFLRMPVEPVPDVARFVFIGRLSRSKAIPILIEAISRLAAEGLEFKVMLIGEGELRSYLEAMIQEKGIGEYLELAGVRTGAEIREELRNSRALLLPSFGEGLPVVVMEAFSLARPVLVSQIAGIPELVVNGENGWIIPPGNIDVLVDSMREILQTPAERLSEMGRHGREAVAEKHDVMREAEKLARLLGSEQQFPA
ncbi:MAG: glycosyltransferase family 4 protein [Planctomycetota bacterium]|jgi:glycosyltransferase involved in cell wall biosynthesis